MRLALRRSVRVAFAVLAFFLIALANARVARADSVRVDFAPNDPAAALVVTRFVPVGQQWERGPVVGGFAIRETLCVGPCVRFVDRAWAIHVGGTGRTSSSMFMLRERDTSVVVRARVGDGLSRDLGGLFLFSGLSSLAMGAGLLGVHLLSRPIDADSVFRTTALVGGAIGVLFVAVGLPLYLSGATTVTF